MTSPAQQHPPNPRKPPSRSDEQAGRRQSPDEAVEESAELVENEARQGDDHPPQHENYGGEPDGRTQRRADTPRRSER